ncbi:RNA ligase family protein [Natronobeatus ordinarius]|uniref:RNA ligase family protein n=1 Tax=Natronobeatus ordinarius TaxID=2963433 RepID=UPI0020CE42E2|nr:RNA ligase family protein [Natronobeatus ordinarius]
MKTYPPIPRVAGAPDHWFEEGHLWLLEKVDGALLRFQLQSSGLLRFGDRERVYDEPAAVPEPYRHAVEHVRANLDRDALRRAMSDVESVVFFAEAMHRQTIAYDWERTPSVLGIDVWSAETGTFLPPDAVDRIFDRLGLTPVNVFERELRARDFDPDAYSIPQSAWYDGPAEGVVVRNKRGGRAKLLHPDQSATQPAPVDASADELAGRYATDSRFETVASTLEERGQPVTVDTLYERTLEFVLREAHHHVHGDGRVDARAFRSAVAARTRTFLDTRADDA